MRQRHQRTIPSPITLLALTTVFVFSAGTAPGQVSDDSITPYNRSLYQHWNDEDKDCQDTRQEVLIAESQSPVELDDTGCTVVSGQWFDPYTGFSVKNPSELDIDHLVPLAEAHRSGAESWDAQRREAFANNLFHADGLIAVTAAANRSKGDRDPANWLPPNEAYRCEYVRDWVIYKFTWGLFMDEAEELAIRKVLQNCRTGRGSVLSTDGVEPPPDPANAPSGGDGDGCTNINTASSEPLQTVVGIGPAKARNIIQYIEQHGPFSKLEDLVKVNGIGPATLENIRTANFCVPEETRPKEDMAATASQEATAKQADAGRGCADINTANSATLQTVTGIGPSKASAIIEHRSRIGPFQSLDDVIHVSGIGAATLQNIREAGLCIK